MSLPVEIDDRVWIDIAEAADFVGGRSEKRARDFVRGVHETFMFLSDFPRAGALYMEDDPRMQAVRKWAVRGFPRYLIFYRYEGDHIEIVRVLNGSRDLPPLLRDER